MCHSIYKQEYRLNAGWALRLRLCFVCLCGVLELADFIGGAKVMFVCHNFQKGFIQLHVSGSISAFKKIYV